MRGALLAGVVVWLAAFAPAAVADVQPWDGSNPFTCTIQNGAAPQDPNADPFCVEYDHSGQSLTDAQTQLLDLLTNGPNRLATSSSKCFLYQVDHWSGSLYSWDSALFFNKATGASGSAVTNVSGLPPILPAGFPSSGGVMSTGG